MKTIVFLVSQLINSGPENVVFNICCHLDRNKFKPIIFSLKNEDKCKSIEKKFKDINIEIYHFGIPTLKLELQPGSVAKIIRQKLSEVNCDILHAHCYHPNLVASHITGYKTITTVHQISGEDFVMKKGRGMGMYMKFRFDRTLKKFNKVAVLSDYMKKYYENCAKDIIKIPNGVHMSINNVERDAFRKEIGVKEHWPVILVTGTLSERKNVLYLLSELKRSALKFNCYVLGTGNKYEECLELINNDERFHLEGFKSNVVDYLSVSDFCISASKSEGLPMSVLEALNEGVPCLLSDIPPHREIMEDIGQDGVSLFPLVEGGLKKQIKEVLTRNYNRDNIKKKAEELYSSVAMTNNYQELYDSI